MNRDVPNTGNMPPGACLLCLAHGGEWGHAEHAKHAIMGMICTFGGWGTTEEVPNMKKEAQ